MDNFSKKYTPEFNCADFVERFPQKPYIYHFTHLFNAVEIIKNRKIISRNLAKGHFTNAAGNLVHRRTTAHDYARFYYRSQTPTQFYNECLGIDYCYDNYLQAVKLGLPKCPMPVFFIFDLEEVIFKMPDKCYYSTGNMQSNWATVKKVSTNPYDLNTDYIYSSFEDDFDNYKQYSQQEFLVLNEFDFSELKSFKIICFDEEQTNILINQLTNDNIIEKISTDKYGVFHRKNRQINIIDNKDSIFISTDYHGDAHFEVKTLNKNIIDIDNTNVIKETADTISAYPNIGFSKTDNPVEIHFIDEQNRNWLIYKNHNQNNEKTDIINNVKWNNISDDVKKLLFKNWLLFDFFQFPISNYLGDDSYGLNEILKCKLELRIKNFNTKNSYYEEFIKFCVAKVSDKIVTKISKMEFVAMEAEIDNLIDFNFLVNLKVLDFHELQSSLVTDFSVIKNNIYVLDYSDYQIIDFSKKSNIDNEENIIYIKGYGWQSELDDILAHLEESSNSILLFYYNKYFELKKLYNTQVRHYTIKEHTELVCSEFDKYFDCISLPINRTLFKIFLSLHDIGKPIASQNGDRSQQHKYTIEIINKYDLSYFQFNVDNYSKKVLTTLASNDCIGEYFQSLQGIEYTCETIYSMAKNIDININNLFYLLMVYYQCDVAAYTKDAGGFPYLEKIFEYDKYGKKVFDNEEKLLRMKPEFWQKYIKLKNFINDIN